MVARPGGDGGRVLVRAPEERDRDAYVALAKRSRRFHAGLASPARDAAGFARLIAAHQRDDYEAFLLVRRQDDAVMGAIAISQIFRFSFQSAYLGYWIGAPYARQGYMKEGLALVLTEAFRRLKLHRLEANIQPENTPSIRLVRGLGFRLEGYSPRYLKIGGRWRDHERWAILREEWSGRA